MINFATKFKCRWVRSCRSLQAKTCQGINPKSILSYHLPPLEPSPGRKRILGSLTWQENTAQQVEGGGTSPTPCSHALKLHIKSIPNETETALFQNTLSKRNTFMPLLHKVLTSCLSVQAFPYSRLSDQSAANELQSVSGIKGQGSGRGCAVEGRRRSNQLGTAPFA